MPEIEGQRALVAVETGEIPAQALAHDTLPAHWVADTRGFDLDHLGTHIGEQHRAERPGEDAGQIDHAQSRQRQGLGLLWERPDLMISQPDARTGARRYRGAGGRRLDPRHRRWRQPLSRALEHAPALCRAASYRADVAPRPCRGGLGRGGLEYGGTADRPGAPRGQPQYRPRRR